MKIQNLVSDKLKKQESKISVLKESTEKLIRLISESGDVPDFKIQLMNYRKMKAPGFSHGDDEIYKKNNTKNKGIIFLFIV